MRRDILSPTTELPLRWVDISGPELPDLTEAAREFGLPPTMVEDCLDPWHLPKQEHLGGATFVILRVFDSQSERDAADVQQMTRKVAIFFRPGLIVTIHRADLPIIAAGKEDLERTPRALRNDAVVLGALFNRALDSFEAPLEKAGDAAESYEDALLTARGSAPDLAAIHRLKRQVTVIKRLLWQTNAMVQRIPPPKDGGAIFHDIKENAESHYYYADELQEEINNLLGIHVALASQRTNEVMRILTLFSAFFLPLTFIVGIYGMNFDHMPELRQKWGYPAVMAVMVVISALIWWYFRRRGWIERR